MSDENRGCLRSLIPCYDELSLCLMSVAFLFLYCTNEELRAESYERLFSGAGAIFLFMLVFFVIGMVFSIRHVFTTKPKTEPEKLLMLWFGVIANYAAGIAAAVHIFREASGWLLIFPLINFIYGVVPVLMGGLTVVDETYVRDDDATPPEVIAGLFFLAALLAVCQYYFDLYWAITFSICVAYAAALSRIVQKVSRVMFFWQETRP